MVVMTWWAARAVVPSHPTIITITEKDAVSIAIWPEMGAPSLAILDMAPLSPPAALKPSLYFASLLSRKK